MWSSRWSRERAWTGSRPTEASGPSQCVRFFPTISRNHTLFRPGSALTCRGGADYDGIIMKLEKLDLLEQRLRRFIERHAQMKEDNDVLRQRLESQAGRLRELEREVDQLQRIKQDVRSRVDRIMGVVEQLELLQDEVANADTDWQSDFWTALIRYIHDEDYSAVKH